MTACCVGTPWGVRVHRADVTVSVPSYQQDACWNHIPAAVRVIYRTTGSNGPYTVTPLEPGAQPERSLSSEDACTALRYLAQLRDALGGGDPQEAHEERTLVQSVIELVSDLDVPPTDR